MEIMEKHDKCFQIECLQEIHKSMPITLSGMQILCACVNLCHHNIQMIEMQLPSCQDTFPSDDISSTILYTSGVTDKLALFQRVLKNPYGTVDISNKQKFEHMIKLWDRRYGNNQFSGMTLDINISIRNRQMEYIQPTGVDLSSFLILGTKAKYSRQQISILIALDISKVTTVY